MNKVVPDIRFNKFIENWEVIKLKDTTSNIGTGRSSFVYNELSKENPYAILGSTSIIGYDNDYDHEGDFILTARVGANAGNLYRYSGKVKISDNTVFIQGEHLSFLYPLLTYFDLKKLSFGTGQPLIKASELKNLKLRLPSLDEQKQVGKFFKRIDAIIKLQQQLLNDHKQLKKAMLQKMFPQKGESVPRLRFAGFTDAWNFLKLKDVGETFTGLSGKNKNDFGHGDAEFVTYINVFKNNIAKIDGTEKVEIDSKQSEVKYGDVFFTTSSETPEEVGMSSVWLGDNKNIYLNSFCFGYRPVREFNVYYLAFMLRSKSVRKSFMFLAQGISRYNISKVKAMDIKIPVPAIEEQTKIGNFFKKLDETIVLHEQKLEIYQELKKAMLQKMFV